MLQRGHRFTQGLGFCYIQRRLQCLKLKFQIRGMWYVIVACPLAPNLCKDDRSCLRYWTAFPFAPIVRTYRIRIWTYGSTTMCLYALPFFWSHSHSAFASIEIPLNDWVIGSEQRHPPSAFGNPIIAVAIWEGLVFEFWEGLVFYHTCINSHVVVCTQGDLIVLSQWQTRHQTRLPLCQHNDLISHSVIISWDWAKPVVLVALS